MEPDIARLAQLLTDPTRAAMLTHLLDGRSWTAGELAAVARIRAPAASVHLKKLVAGDVVRVSPQGRHRYFRLSGAGVAGLLEQMQCHAPLRPVTPGEKRAAPALRHCRLCYDHVAGVVGVSLAQAMIDRALLVEDEPWYRLTAAGTATMLALGVRPSDGRTCMDWSERRFHLGGALGAELARCMLAQRCLLRDRRSRALLVTAQGWDMLGQTFGIVRVPVPARADAQSTSSSAGARKL